MFNAMGTQWRVGQGGRTGLDYNALLPVLRMHGIPRAQWPDLFESIRVLEGAALDTMMEQRND